MSGVESDHIVRIYPGRNGLRTAGLFEKGLEPDRQYRSKLESHRAADTAFGGEMQATPPQSPNPQDVANTIVKLIGTPKGQRPLRTVVDPITGKYIEAANEAVAAQLAQGLTVFGMGELLQ
ncbi:hypothetical protein [Mucilaginibacter sp. SG564]|uniref:hypothetical protein n=1 Tax=Mucilaginibacter sp. SG564 TaxID=2587022 RepID=UPI001C12C439|nr:hypothetical protein [Mucilaginibacter sp. SG564]NOW96353.1 hypothetical protein [Mucilaginibacter sp. SG564]